LLQLGRLVAIKCVTQSEELGAKARDDAYSRALREATLAAQLNHHNVVTVYDAVEYGGYPCIIMQYVSSQTLSHLVSRAGGRVISGLQMLLHQAFAQVEQFTGLPAPAEAMRVALAEQ